VNNQKIIKKIGGIKAEKEEKMLIVLQKVPHPLFIKFIKLTLYTYVLSFPFNRRLQEISLMVYDQRLWPL